MKTMNQTYGDGSDHKCCSKCGMCITCGDCEKFGCGADETKIENLKGGESNG